MNRVQSSSIPRSGHHLLVICLQLYFPQLKYCNFYGCCQQIGCKEGAHFQKNHDDDSRRDKKKIPALSTDLDIPYVIQYRRSAQSTLNAMYRNVFLKGKFGEKRPQNDESRRRFFGKKWIAYEKFVHKRRDYYHKFIEKWLVHNKNPKAYFLEYYDFIERPAYHLSNIVKIFDPNCTNNKKLDQVIKEANIGLKYDLKKCPLYRKDFNKIFDMVDPPFRVGFG